MAECREDRPLVLAGPGMAFTTWLAARELVGDPAVFWGALRLPDLFVVSAGRLWRADRP